MSNDPAIIIFANVGKRDELGLHLELRFLPVEAGQQRIVECLLVVRRTGWKAIG